VRLWLRQRLSPPPVTLPLAAGIVSFELVIFCVFAIGIPLSIALSLHESVRSMLRATVVQEDAASSADYLGRLLEPYRGLLETEGFRFTKVYSFQNTKFGLWLQISARPPLRFFSLLKPQGGGPLVHEFITAFSDQVSLTTTTTRSAFLFPRPFGSFLQSFPGYLPEALWRAHLQGEEHLISTVHISVEECRLPFLEAFNKDVMRKMSHVTSFPF